MHASAEQRRAMRTRPGAVGADVRSLLPTSTHSRLTPVNCPFSASHFLGHGFGIIPAPGSFASSAFPVPPCESSGPSQYSAPRLGSSSHSALGWPKEMGQKRRNKNVPESRPTHRLPRKRSGEAASPRQRRELHGSVS